MCALRFYLKTSTSGDSIHSSSTQPTASTSSEVKVDSPSDPPDLISFSDSPDGKKEPEDTMDNQNGAQKVYVIYIIHLCLFLLYI